MSSSTPGNTTSPVEVTRIPGHGVWMLAHEEFPWFEQPSPGHFYWPDRDVDLTEEITEYPERFPEKPGTTGPLNSIAGR